MQEAFLRDILSRVGEIQYIIGESQDTFFIIGAVIIGILSLIWITRW